ncbi:lactate utilization protein C [Calidifontibacter sp. DB0510]|uniref:Lactate utilization protein C n=1 Tax=Metallococcus carri TaxID=1656884 RepID=A0A967AZE2_9MICO|nr:lactate utilization protein C [Metallococcus carri]NHN55919.1 lactate utilization protein C [Metallococcus carri]NOP38393.1 lactate utilization protein C [Calidifontibacter sp. DB2511S]
MTTAREEVLARIRAAGAARPVEVPPAPEPSPQPAPETVDLFAENVADYRAVVERLAESAVPQRISSALGQYGVTSVVVPDGLPSGWLTDAALRVLADERLTAYDLDAIDAVVTQAAVGIAETGTIVLDHTAGQGRRALSLVPDVHLCVIRADQVVGDVPAAVRQLRPAVETGRPLTWISGPSATSDIELNRVEGVHGPRHLHVLIVGDEA